MAIKTNGRFAASILQSVAADRENPANKGKRMGRLQLNNAVIRSDQRPDCFNSLDLHLSQEQKEKQRTITLHPTAYKLLQSISSKQ